MKLYRGYQQKPNFWNEAAEREYQDLLAEQEKHASHYKKYEKILKLIHRGGLYEEGYVFKKMGKRFLRKVALMRQTSDQFFGDIKESAYKFAGDNGFVAELDVSDDVARAHYITQEVMQGLIVANYLFSGKEIANFEKEGRISIHDVKLEREKEFREGNEGYFGRRK